MFLSGFSLKVDKSLSMHILLKKKLSECKKKRKITEEIVRLRSNPGGAELWYDESWGRIGWMKRRKNELVKIKNKY